MLRRRTAQGAFAIALLVALALTACAPENTPDDQPPQRTDSPTEPSAGAPQPPDALTTPPAAASAMSQPNEAGAEAAARYFVQLYDYIFATGDLAPWNAVSSDTCEFCGQVAEDVRAIAPGSVLVQAGPSQITSLRAWEISDDQWFGADMVVDQPATDQFDEAGKLISSGPGGTVRLALALTWAGGWSVDAVDVLDPDESPKW